jgi:hypothetical protein
MLTVAIVVTIWIVVAALLNAFWEELSAEGSGSAWTALLWPVFAAITVLLSLLMFGCELWESRPKWWKG